MMTNYVFFSDAIVEANDLESKKLKAGIETLF